MKANGYARVSTEEQSRDEVSLEAQQAKIAAWCTAYGYELAGMHVDAGLSDSRALDGPALQAALAQACKQGAALVVYSLSRLAQHKGRHHHQRAAGQEGCRPSKSVRVHRYH